MQDCKSANTPISASLKLGKDDFSKKVDENMYRSLVVSLLYLIASKPTILLTISLLSRFMHSPRETYFTTTKRMLR